MLVTKTAASWLHTSAPKAATNITRDARASRSHHVEIPQGEVEDLQGSFGSRPVYVLSGLGWRYG
ncbi:hypothetical protein [Pendulispora albinea]|uniref:Uncharacterized protein n=1 Tax=Pendulispora albinea TaxID=2741071 RepID=A0ABZ2LKZ9_9BACT